MSEDRELGPEMWAGGWLPIRGVIHRSQLGHPPVDCAADPEPFGAWRALRRAGTDGRAASWYCRCVKCGHEAIRNRDSLMFARRKNRQGCVKCGNRIRIGKTPVPILIDGGK